MAINKSNTWRTKRSMDAQKAQFPTKGWDFHVHRYPLDLESNVELSHYVGFYISLPHHRMEDIYVTGGSSGKVKQASADAVRNIQSYQIGRENTGDMARKTLKAVGQWATDTQKQASEEQVLANDQSIGESWDQTQNRESSDNIKAAWTNAKQMTTAIIAEASRYLNLEKAGNSEIKMTHEAIMLYFPETLSTAYELDWQADSMRGMAILAKTVSDALNIGNDKPITTDGITKAVAGGMANIALNAAFGDLLSAATKQIQNPYMEMLFRGVQNRSLELSFKFTPRSEKEAQEVHRIITTFKRYGLPKVTGQGNIASTFYAYPAEWDIIFYTVPKEGSKLADHSLTNTDILGPHRGAGDKAIQNRYISRYGRSVLESINVNYTPAGPSFHRPDQDKAGAAPVETDLTLRFKEIDLVTADLVENEALGF